MTGAKSVVNAFIATGKTADALIGPQRFKLIAATGQDLVRIRLVPDIKDNFVPRTVKHLMQCQRKLDNSEIGSEMTTGAGNRLNHQFSDFFRQRRQLIKVQLVKVLGRTKVFQITSQAKSPFQV